MDEKIGELVRMMPPPSNPRFVEVQWPALEEAVGLRYPKSFKEYVAVYGGAVWFDNWCPLYAAAKNDEEIRDYLRTVSNYTSRMKGCMVKPGKQRRDVEIALYPDQGGLLPFLIDYSGGVYSWKTANTDPDKWPVVCWVDSYIIELRGITIAGMFLEFLRRSERMRRVWGDVNDLEEYRRRVDRG